jgi:hypothetical protein
MRKGILVVLVLTAWVVLRNQTYTQVFANKPSNVKQTAAIVAKTISNDLFQFTSVHLSAPRLNAKKKMPMKKVCLFQAADKQQHKNHEPLLLINSL